MPGRRRRRRQRLDRVEVQPKTVHSARRFGTVKTVGHPRTDRQSGGGAQVWDALPSRFSLVARTTVERVTKPLTQTGRKVEAAGIEPAFRLLQHYFRLGCRVVSPVATAVQHTGASPWRMQLPGGAPCR